MAPIPADPAFLERVFATEAGEESLLFIGTDQSIEFAVRVNGVRPTALRPLDDVRDEVEAAWTEEARANALKEMAVGVADDAQTTSVPAVADGLQREAVVSMPLGRDSYDDLFGPELLQQIFSVPAGSVIYGLTATQGEYIVARIEEVTHPMQDVTAADYQDLSDTLGAQLGNDLIDAFAKAAQEEAGVTTYPAVIDTTLGQGVLF